MIQPLLRFCLPGKFSFHCARRHDLCGFGLGLFIYFLLIAVFFFCRVGEENESPVGSEVAAHQKWDLNEILCSHGRAKTVSGGLWEEKQTRIRQAPALGSKKVATIHPDVLKVRVLTSHPLHWALLGTYQQLPAHLSKEIPLIFTDSCFLWFSSPGLVKKKQS